MPRSSNNQKGKKQARKQRRTSVRKTMKEMVTISHENPGFYPGSDKKHWGGVRVMSRPKKAHVTTGKAVKPSLVVDDDGEDY